MTLPDLLYRWAELEPERCHITGGCFEFRLGELRYSCWLEYQIDVSDAGLYSLLGVVVAAINAHENWEWCIMSQSRACLTGVAYPVNTASPASETGRITYLAEILRDKDDEWQWCDESPEREHPAIVLLEVYLRALEQQ